MEVEHSTRHNGLCFLAILCSCILCITASNVIVNIKINVHVMRYSCIMLLELMLKDCIKYTQKNLEFSTRVRTIAHR